MRSTCAGKTSPTSGPVCPVCPKEKLTEWAWRSLLVVVMVQSHPHGLSCVAESVPCQNGWLDRYSGRSGNSELQVAVLAKRACTGLSQGYHVCADVHGPKLRHTQTVGISQEGSCGRCCATASFQGWLYGRLNHVVGCLRRAS